MKIMNKIYIEDVDKDLIEKEQYLKIKRFIKFT